MIGIYVGDMQLMLIIEVLFNHIVDGNFIYKGNHMITLSSDKAFIKKKGVSILIAKQFEVKVLKH